MAWPSPRRPVDLSTLPTSPVASVASSTGPDSAASAYTTSDTRRRPFSWSRAWTSSSSRNSSDTPTSASPPASTPTSESASNARPSTAWPTPSSWATTAPPPHPPQLPFADVAAERRRGPSGTLRRGLSNIHLRAARERTRRCLNSRCTPARIYSQTSAARKTAAFIDQSGVSGTGSLATRS